MNIVYSFNKKGFEAEYWQTEIAAASTAEFTFIPFNYDPFLDSSLYSRAQLLDNLYYKKHPGLLRLYAAFEKVIKDNNATAVMVIGGLPYHPDYLRNIPIYKVLITSDGPLAAYDRDFAYLHAYQQIFYHSPAYSADIGMAEKLRYCKADNIDWLPLGLFDVFFDQTKTENDLVSQPRDIDIIFIGAFHLGKMPFLAKIKQVFGRRLKMHGLSSWKKNLYFNLKFGFPGWITPISFKQYVPLYQRSKIGINIHNRGDYTVGGFRLFELPANGVMQISDGGDYLSQFFEVGEEIIGYRNVDDCIDKVRYYLDHEDERNRISINGYRRVLKDYRFADLMHRAGELIQTGMARIGWQP